MSSWNHHLVFFGLLLQVRTYLSLSGGSSLRGQELSIDTMDTHTLSTVMAGDQSSARMERQICPLLKTQISCLRDPCFHCWKAVAI